MAEHSGAYARLVQGLKVPGLEVYGWDLRGHGQSEGREGVVRHFDDFAKDLIRFVHLVIEQRGHSGRSFYWGIHGRTDYHAGFGPSKPAARSEQLVDEQNFPV